MFIIDMSENEVKRFKSYIILSYGYNHCKYLDVNTRIFPFLYT